MNQNEQVTDVAAELQALWDTAGPDDVLHFSTNDYDGERPGGERASMLVVCPHTDVQPATKIFLAEIEDGNVAYRKVEGDYGYCKLLRELWAVGESFIIIEQDIVPFGGAIKELSECEHDWCLCGYHHYTNFETERTYMGLVKIGAGLIAATPGLWDSDVHWSECDLRLDSARSVCKPHQHAPHVLNANPKKIDNGMLVSRP